MEIFIIIQPPVLVMNLPNIFQKLVINIQTKSSPQLKLLVNTTVVYLLVGIPCF